MRTGKVLVSRVFLARPHLGEIDIDEAFLAEVRHPHYSLPPGEPSAATRAEIRDALERYLGCHIKEPAITCTERRRMLRKLKVAVERCMASARPDEPNPAVLRALERGIASDLDIRLLDTLGLARLLGLDRNDCAKVSGCIERLGESWRLELRRHLDDAETEGRLRSGAAREFLNFPHQGTDCLPLVAEFCDAALGAGRPDPYLSRLVHDLAPMWRRLTGRPLGAVDDACKELLFGQWVVRKALAATKVANKELAAHAAAAARDGFSCPPPVKLQVAFTPNSVRDILQRRNVDSRPMPRARLAVKANRPRRASGGGRKGMVRPNTLKSPKK
jgi:hypothetical protein